MTCCSLKRDPIVKSRPGSAEARSVPVLVSKTSSRPVFPAKNQAKLATTSGCDVDFDSKTHNSVTFDESTLDAWFTQNLIFKVYSR